MASVSSGIRRKVDDLGRVVIPAGIRRSLNIREGDAVEVSVDGERIVLTKPRDACVFCGREGDDLHRFRSRLVCRECVATIGRVDDELQLQGSRPVAGTPLPAAPPAATPSVQPEPVWPTGPIDGDAFARSLARGAPAHGTVAQPAADPATAPTPLGPGDAGRPPTSGRSAGTDGDGTEAG